MLPQRAAQQMLRRMALRQPAARFVVPTAIASSNALVSQRRHAAATTISAHEANNAILAKQRLNRPVSPHLGIYQPQITWYLSIFNRITGSVLSGSMYIYGAAYLVAPYLGWHLESAVVAASFASLPLLVQFATKSFFGFFFTFHCFNGVRHLVWDTASMITNKQVNQTGYFVVALSAVSALALAFL